jgi:hypothetical protein
VADLINSLIKHLRTDATIIGVTTAARIGFDLTPGGTLPQMAVVPISDTPGDVYVNAYRVSFLAESTPANRAQMETIRQRLRVLFHDKRGWALSTGTDAMNIIESVSAGGEGITKDTDDGPWQLQEFYIFTIGDSF